MINEDFTWNLINGLSKFEVKSCAKLVVIKINYNISGFLQ